MPTIAERTGVLSGDSPDKKPDPKDYGDLFEDTDTAPPAKTAGPAAPSGKPKPENYADLFHDTTAPAQATFAQRFEPVDKSGLFGEMGNQIRQHPYIAGGLAALMLPAAVAVGAEVGIPALIGAGGSALMGLLRNRAVQTGTGIAIGQQLGPRAGDALHFLLRQAGIEE